MEKEKKSKIALVQMILTAVILAVIIVTSVVLISSALSVQRNMALIEKDLQEIDMEQLNDTVSSLNEAASALGKLDMESINEIIASLNNTAQSISSVADTVGSIFGKPKN